MRPSEIGNDAELAMPDVGASGVVLLLHGWPVTAYHWRHTRPVLVAAGLRPIAVELRGLGARTYTVTDYVSGRKLGSVRGPIARLETQFEKYLLLEARPE